MRIGIFVSTRGASDLEAWLERFAPIEEAGFHTAWVGQIFEYDALTLLALAGRITRRIELGSWVVPSYPRHPSSLALQALTAQAACGGRLLLGIGVSHAAVVEGKLGLDFSRPLRHMREYLSVLKPLLAGQTARFEGGEFQVSLRLRTPAQLPPPLWLAALGPRMLGLAGAEADGVAIWLGGPRYLEEFALPRIRAAAQAAGRASPRVAAGLPVAVADASRARASAEALLAPSSSLPAYREVLARAGVRSPGQVAICGSAAEVERQLADLAALGVSDFNAVPFPVEGDPGAPARTQELLAGLARRESPRAPALPRAASEPG